MTRTALVLAITFFAAHPSVHAQVASRAPLDPAVIKAVDVLYPGFEEILERDDAAGLVRLARILSDRPSAESLAVLLWMLRHSPAWREDGALLLDKTIRAVGRLPLALVADALLHATAAQRVTAAAVLASHGQLVSEAEKPLLDKTLIAALADRDDRVRDMVLAALRGRNSGTATAAVCEYLARQPARRRPRPFDPAAFPPATIALLDSLHPEYKATLSTLNEQAVRRLLATLQGTTRPEATPVLLWLLANGDARAYVGNVVHQLGEQQRAVRLPLGELASMLRTAEPERKALIAELCAKVFTFRNPPGADRDRVIAALIESLAVPVVDVRTSVIAALGRGRAREAIDPIARLLDGPDPDRYEMPAVQALAAIGAAEVLPLLERLARTSRSGRVREQAASAYLAIAKPADPAAQARRLLWEPPGTALEKRVLAEGKAVLPAVWQALANGSADERRVAAALLGWFRDRQSIGPILAALDAAPGALTREQLLFDLNMILLTEATEAAPDDRNALAVLHLHWLYDQLVNHPIDSDIRTAVEACRTVNVFPDRVGLSFSATLVARSAGQKPSDASKDTTATAAVAASAEAFLAAVRKDGCGVAFHAITEAHGVARVASTLYLPKGRVANQVWISLYRRESGRWRPLPVPSHPILQRMINEPSLMPTVNRNYGPDHPLKILRLDLTMERIRVDLNAREYFLRSENRENPLGPSDLDESYVPLLERYERADAAAVKYTAEFESARLTNDPDLPVWIDALSPSVSGPVRQMAQQVLAAHLAGKFKIEGRQLAGPERDNLVTAALSPEPVNPQLVRVPPPRAENIRNARQWSRFGLVDVMFGSEPRGRSGYSMLFERRGNRWVFLCIISSWIE